MGNFCYFGNFAHFSNRSTFAFQSDTKGHNTFVTISSPMDRGDPALFCSISHGYLELMKAPVSLSPEELLALLACARKRRIRDWTAILICYWCGLRRSELVDIRARDIQDGCLTIQRLKGSEKTQQLLQWHSEPLLDAKSAMEEWLRVGKSFGKKGGAKTSEKDISASFHPDDRLFPISGTQFWSLMRKYGREAGIPARKLHPHALKHSIGRHLIDAGVPVNRVQMHLGHKSLGSTGKYLMDDEDAVSRAVGRAIRGEKG